MRNPGANFGFVGEYSIVASTGGSFARSEQRSTSIASIGIVDGMTLDAVLAVDICCATMRLPALVFLRQLCLRCPSASFHVFMAVGEQVEDSR